MKYSNVSLIPSFPILTGHVSSPPSTNNLHLRSHSPLKCARVSLAVILVAIGGAVHAQTGPGTALRFNGLGSYVKIPSSPSQYPGSNSFTIEAWVSTTNATAEQMVVSKYECGGNCPAGANSLYFFFISEGVVGANLRTSLSDLTQSIYGSHLVADGNFHHIAMLRDITAGQMRIYVDGLLDASAALQTNSFGSIQNDDPEDDPLLIGAYNLNGTSGGVDFFQGTIDEVRIWNVARTQAQIQTNMNRSLDSPQPGLAGYWRFDEAMDNFAFDSSGQNTTGILTNGPLWVASSIPFVPGVVTQPASAITPASATLNGRAYPHGIFSRAWFEWGGTTNYGNATSITNVGSGTNSVSVSRTLSNLLSGASYHYRLTASNSIGAGFGLDQSFMAGQAPQVFINEWMASNTRTITNSQGDFSDWFELYNNGNNPLDLSGYYLTDTLSNKTEFRIPDTTIIPAGGFLFIWADGLTNLPGLHVSFKFSKAGEAIGLYSPALQTIDEVEFGLQSDDISQGRWPDGTTNIYFMDHSSPGSPNSLAPFITVQPQGQAVIAGNSVAFTVVANGNAPLSYQWQLNGSILANATNEIYNITNVQLANAGSYSVTVRNAFGSTSISNILLVVTQLDFGDAPDPNYPTLLAHNGARHIIVPGVYLGSSVDAEPDGQPNPDATGDDSSPEGAVNDEDGVSFLTPLVQGQLATIQVIASTNGYIHAWLDFDASGWGGSGNQIFNSRFLAAGTSTLTFLVPASATPGDTYARFRFTSQTNISFFGLAPDGEVEDYKVTIKGDPCRRTSKGTDFWLTFPANYAPDPDNPVQLSLCIAGPVGTRGKVTIPGLGFSSDFTVAANMGTTVSLPQEADLGPANDRIQTNGIHVTASAEVGVYGFNHVTNTSDAFMAIPSDVLGRDYTILGYKNVYQDVPELNGTQFAVVACENDTRVRITPSVSTGPRVAGVAYQITLQQGYTYQLRNTNGSPNDLSGTRIVADKPIAVFGSHRCANIQSSNTFFCDYLVEQLLPLERWGLNFFVIPLATRSVTNTYRLLAAEDDTTITAIFGNSQQTTIGLSLNHQEWRELLLDGPVQISADKRIFVAQYANSASFDRVRNSDPFMVTIPPTKMFLTSYMVYVPDKGFRNNYVNVVVPTTAAASVQIDNVTLGVFDFDPIFASGYSGVKVAVLPGPHVISAQASFGLTVYGFDEFDGYGYPGGMSFGDITPPTVLCPPNSVIVTSNCMALVPGMPVSPSDDCTPSAHLVVVQTPPPGTKVGPGIYPITMTVTDAAGNTGICTTILTVEDSNPIAFVEPSDIVRSCTSKDGVVVDYGPITAYSVCTSNFTITCTPPSGSLFLPGDTSVVCVATNSAGQSAITTFIVTVKCLVIRITPFGSKFEVTWTGAEVLQTATNLFGGASRWQDIATTNNSYIILPLDRLRFFRLRP